VTGVDSGAYAPARNRHDLLLGRNDDVVGGADERPRRIVFHAGSPKGWPSSMSGGWLVAARPRLMAGVVQIQARPKLRCVEVEGGVLPSPSAGWSTPRSPAPAPRTPSSPAGCARTRAARSYQDPRVGRVGAALESSTCTQRRGHVAKRLAGPRLMDRPVERSARRERGRPSPAACPSRCPADAPDAPPHPSPHTHLPGADPPPNPNRK
jgi:hypothetical protein